MTNFKGSFDDIIKIFIPNASGYKIDAKTEGKKVLLGKLASSIRDFCHGLWSRKSLLLVIVHLPRKRLVQETNILKWHYTVERARSCNLST